MAARRAALAVVVAALAVCACGFQAPSAPARQTTACRGAKTDAVLGLLRRVPLAGRLVRAKKHREASPAAAAAVAAAPAAPAEPDVAALLDRARDEAALLLEDVVRREVGDLYERGIAVPFEAKSAPAPAPAPASDPVADFDAAHAAGDFEPLLEALRGASRDGAQLDAAVEWRYARACLDVADARGDASREGLVREGLEAARRAAAIAPEDGLAQKWLGIMLGSVGDYETTKEKLGNSYAIKEALDVAWAQRPDDATVALALGQWCLKVASVSFVERGLARAIFGGKPPESTFAEALDYFQKADALKPASKTKALIKLVKKKMA